MVDEAAFKQARSQLNPKPCAFEKAVLAGCCTCPATERRHIAEREVVACREPSAQARCLVLRALLQQKSAFALKHRPRDEPLPHAHEMKVQCGGLLGLQQTAAPAAEVADVAQLVRVAERLYGTLENLPWPRIIQGIAGFRLRRRL